MDSLTQIVLGASVAEATLGKKIGNKAIVLGAIAGTIPDLDIVSRFFVDDLTATVMHRGFSHSFLFPFVAAPILAWVLKKIYSNYTDVSFNDWFKMFFLAIITHPLLDAQTTWGTQLFWPLEWRVAIENIFIIDPIYTFPFLTFLILTAFQDKLSKKRKLYNSLGLIISSAYLLMTLSFKGIAHYKIAKALEENNIEYKDINTRATYFNSILWSSQVELEDSYIFTYYSLFDKSKPVFTKTFPKNHNMLQPFIDEKKIQQLIIISNGHYLMTKENNELIFWNLKLGLKGFDENASPYIWSYVIKNNKGEIFFNETNEKMDALKIQEKRSFRKNRKYSEELSAFYERLKGI
ncbi:MAG: metal-dependent hydrolase [Flavobacteriaceae bacterium]